jgi:hypothetical protein
MHLTAQQKSPQSMTRPRNLRHHLLQQSSQPTLLRMQSSTYRKKLQRKLATMNLKHYHHHLRPKLPLNLQMPLSH